MCKLFEKHPVAKTWTCADDRWTRLESWFQARMSLAPVNAVLAHTVFHVPPWIASYQMKTDLSTSTTHARAG